MKFEPPAWDGAAERGADGFDERSAFLAGDMASREVAHLAVFDVHQIAADRPVIRPQGNAHRGRFERRAAGVDHERVVAKETERGHIAGRSERVRNIVGTADNASLGDAVHVRLVRGL
jgi:hypothetical protein